MQTTVDIRYDTHSGRATVVMIDLTLTDSEIQQLVKTLTVFHYRDVHIYTHFDDGATSYDGTRLLHLYRNDVRMCTRDTAILLSIEYSYSSSLGKTWIQKAVEKDVQIIVDELTTVGNAWAQKNGQR